MKLKVENKLLTNFSLSSLTAVVMLLLIFFFVSSSLVMSSGINIQFASATGEAGNEKKVNISLTDKGRLYVNAERVTLANVGRKIAFALHDDPNKIVVVNTDKNVTLRNAVQLIDIAKAAGATRFLIATPPPSQQ